MDDDEQMVAAYTAGASARELAERFDVTTKTVLNRLTRAGVARRPRGRRPSVTRLDDRGWLIDEYQHRSRSAADVAAEIGCSETAVLEALHRHGISVRRRGGGVRREPMPAQLGDRAWLRAHYVGAGLSIRAIAAEVGVSASAVANALRSAGIPRRPVGNTSSPAGATAPPPTLLPRSGHRRGARPIGVLPDGTEYYVPLGRLEFADDDRRVLCHLCGAPFRLLSATHLRGHGWTPQAYRQAFGLNRGTPLCAPAVSEQRRVTGRDRYARDARVRTGLAHGQELVRSGAALALAHAAMPAGSAPLQRRLRAAEATAAAHQQRQDEAATRRQRRVRELGFASDRAYLRDRYVRRRWGIARIKVELRVGSGVVERMLDTARIPRRPAGGGR